VLNAKTEALLSTRARYRSTPESSQHVRIHFTKSALRRPRVMAWHGRGRSDVISLAGARSAREL
jgi:hypothetical protein